jgi:hypothetical protein
MKKQTLDIAPQFIVDKTGKKTGVLLDIATFEQLLEKVEELYLGLEAERILEDESEFQDFETIKN